MNKLMIPIVVMTLVIGAILGYWLSPKHSVIPTSQDKEASQEPLFYRNPMNPEITSQVPAKDSMGMEYIPVYADNKSGPKEPSGTVTIDPVVVQNIGVRTKKAKRQNLSRSIRAIGRVDFAEDRITRLHPKVEGWIEQIFIDKTGQEVRKNAILLALYSPKLVSTQQEYLLALSNLAALQKSNVEDIKQGAQSLVKSAKERLRLLDVPAHQIRELEKTRETKQQLHIHSPSEGTVIKIGARLGQFVTPKTELYTIVNLDQVWVYADIYDHELPWVKVGDLVEMELASVPGRTFTGKLAYIYPYAEAKTRTTKVRIIFDNPDRLLRPDMLTQVKIAADLLENVIAIPVEAIVRTGGKNQVFIAKGAGKFEPRLVNLGFESDGQVAVLDGVQAGENVVISAQFLLDSESKLREATMKMLETAEQEDKDTENPKSPSQHNGAH